jgi:hypothetical protein
MDQVKILITIEKETRNTFKSLVAKEGETMTKVINTLIIDYVKKNRPINTDFDPSLVCLYKLINID